jgi:hypothetical protein
MRSSRYVRGSCPAIGHVAGDGRQTRGRRSRRTAPPAAPPARCDRGSRSSPADPPADPLIPGSISITCRASYQVGDELLSEEDHAQSKELSSPGISLMSTYSPRHSPHSSSATARSYLPASTHTRPVAQPRRRPRRIADSERQFIGPELTTTRKATAMSPQPATPTPQPVPRFPLDPPHAHTASCFWDLAQCRWQCGSPAALNDGPAPELNTADNTARTN